MRLAAFDAAGTARMGVVEGGTIRPLCAVDEFYAAVDEWLGRAAALDTEAVALADVTAVPPCP